MPGGLSTRHLYLKIFFVARFRKQKNSEMIKAGQGEGLQQG
jgi:hypothetical protein